MIMTGCTDIGCRYEENQDCYRAGKLSDNTFWLVLCDGMGGLELGGKASRMAAERLGERLEKKLVDLLTPEDIRDFLKAAIQDCSFEIYKESRLLGEDVAMGTTVVAAVVSGQTAIIAHCGDSRAYHLQKKAFRRVTRDHSVVQELLDSGKITEEQAQRHPNKNIITSALGVELTVKLDIDEVRLQKNDMLLLCSDGLSNMLDDAQIAATLRESDFYMSATELVRKAVEAGGYDNVTALVLKA